MSVRAWGNHFLTTLAVIFGIVGMGLVYDSISGGNLRELSYGVPMLFISLWWAGRMLGLSIAASEARTGKRSALRPGR